jgi:hypothetical protein
MKPTIAYFLLSSLVILYPVSLGAEEYDLKGTALAGKLGAFLDKLPRIGNNGETTIDRLVYDSTSNKICGQATLRAAHTWKLKFAGEDFEESLGAEGVFTFDFHCQTGDFNGNATIPLGKIEKPIVLKVGGLRWEKTIDFDFGSISVGISDIRSILDGDYLNALKIPTGGIVTKRIRSDYDDLQKEVVKKHGGSGNIYFADDLFVSNMRESRGYLEIGAIIVSDGLLAQPLVKKFLRELQDEAKRLMGWVKMKFKNEFREDQFQPWSTIAKINLDSSDWNTQRDLFMRIQELANGRLPSKLQPPAYHVQLSFAIVKYWSQNEVLKNPVGPVFQEKHLAFFW